MPPVSNTKIFFLIGAALSEAKSASEFSAPARAEKSHKPNAGETESDATSATRPAKQSHGRRGSGADGGGGVGGDNALARFFLLLLLLLLLLLRRWRRR
jgi:hypothetical protein